MSIRDGRRMFVLFDGTLWIRTYRVGGFDGYRTINGKHRLPCDTLERQIIHARMMQAMNGTGEFIWKESGVTRRMRARLWREHQVDRIAIALVEHGHTDLAEKLWRTTRKW